VTVYVLTVHYDYEGEDAIGVFDSLDKAKACADVRAAEYGWESVPWAEQSKDFWRLDNGGSTSFIIRKEVVQ
jgi:hypothetical protein